ncbi:hypothetical protein LCGC14_2396800, partial [marine sediment metagenome]
MNTPRVLREAEAILRHTPPIWQGECSHVCTHATVASHRLGSEMRCCRCDA